MLLPRVDGCGCRLCAGEVQADPVDQECLDQVLEHGWRVMLVGAGNAEDQPAFAYTVGLPHRTGHPELVMTGLPFEVMHPVLNDLSRRVLAGFPLAAGDLAEGALARVPLLVEEMSPAGIAESVTWSRWFHRRDVDALQVVWPSTLGVFAWQQGGDAQLDVVQPQRWRQPAERTGAVARKPEWLLPISRTKQAFVCRHVAEEGEPVLSVSRELDPEAADGTREQWQVLCDADHSAPGGEAVLVPLQHVVRIAPSLRGLDLQVGEIALRKAAWLPWERTRL